MDDHVLRKKICYENIRAREEGIKIMAERFSGFSAGALALTVTFRGNIACNSMLSNLLILSWVFFIATIIGSAMVLIGIVNHHAAIVERLVRTEDHVIVAQYPASFRVGYRMAMYGFICGMVTLAGCGCLCLTQ